MNDYKMNDLITVNYNSEQPTVLGRDLHKALSGRKRRINL